MKRCFIIPLLAAASFILPSAAQPSYEGPAPSVAPVTDSAQRLADYHARIDEVMQWRDDQRKRDDPAKLDMAAIAIKLTLGQDLDVCSQRVIELMKDPGTGPFWMFPCVGVSFAGRERLTTEARQSIRKAWQTTRQIRGDTENHFVMYYASLYLMSQLYANEPGETWYTGKSSEENLVEARGFLLNWMDLTTTVGQGEYNPTHYIGEYAIPMLY